MVRNQKIVRAAQAAEDRRQEREMRKNGQLPPRDASDVGGEDDCCCNQKPPIPKGWSRHNCETHQLLYYYNETTHETTWRRPKEVPPSEKGLTRPQSPSAELTQVVPSPTAPTMLRDTSPGMSRSSPSMDRYSHNQGGYSGVTLNRATTGTNLRKKPKPPPPAEPPTQAERRAAVYDELCFSMQLVFCWCFLYQAV